ncbi:hypothetical protein [Staphylococcus auricularis]|uniref:hypothetical protein n=1 Tax=Staphylococcus auricularis TaxID=29379 RepID=UPI0013003845|nr:hypothetical protein [Staphylococcus auricularis]MEB6569441.1 hypothetical protein [Staphylococcus auricularis]
MEKQEKRKHRQYSMLERWKMDTERFKKMSNSTKEERERRIQEFIDIVNNKKNRNSKK